MLIEVNKKIEEVLKEEDMDIHSNIKGESF